MNKYPIVMSEAVSEGTIYLIPPDIVQEMYAIAIGKAFGLDMSKREAALKRAIEERKSEFGVITDIDTTLDVTERSKE